MVYQPTGTRTRPVVGPGRQDLVTKPGTTNPNPAWASATAIPRNPAAPGAPPGQAAATSPYPQRTPTPGATPAGTSRERIPGFDSPHPLGFEGAGGAQYAAEVQAYLNRQTADASKRIADTNEVTPWGSTEYTGTPGMDYTRWTRLNPTLSSALSKSQQGQNVAADAAYRRMFEFGGRAPVGHGGPGVRALEDASFGSARRLMDPVFGREREGLQQQLADQGIAGGTMAGLNARGDLDRRHSGMLTDAAFDAVFAGRRERDSLFGQELASRQTELSELGNLFGMGQVTPPAYSPPSQPGVAPTNFLGALAQQQALAQQKQGQDRAFWSNVIGTGSSLLPFFFPQTAPFVAAGNAATGGNPFSGSSGWLGSPGG